MRIRFTRHDVWWMVTLQKGSDISTYSYVWPMVYYWLQEQLDIRIDPSILRFVRLFVPIKFK